jgi:UDP-glucose 4-epimerase
LNLYKHVLVTGGAGFIGSNLANRLIHLGHTVTVVDNLSNGKRENVPFGALFLVGDITDKAFCEMLADIPFDAVFHLAAQSSGALSFDDPDRDMASHVLGTFNILRICLTKGVNRFIFSSSSTIYGDAKYLPVDEVHPITPKMYYSAGKSAAESYIRFAGSQGMHVTIFRLPNVYGGGQNLNNKNQGMISIYLSYILEGVPILVKGSKDRFRDFVHVDDVVQGWMLGFENETAFGKTYNLGSGQRATVRNVLDSLMLANGTPGYPVVIDSNTPGDQFGMVLDITKIQKDLGYMPSVCLSQGISRMVSQEKKENGL